MVGSCFSLRSREWMGMEPAETDCQTQFQAAVRVIQGLPKNGSYRPPYEVMLQFYSYYKQATVGSCEIPRPGFWDPIGRYKWDAWNRLGKMPKEEAMAAYVSEMKKIAQKVIDTIPAGEMSEDVFGFFEPLYEVIHDMPRPPDSFFKKKAGKPGALGWWLGRGEMGRAAAWESGLLGSSIGSATSLLKVLDKDLEGLALGLLLTRTCAQFVISVFPTRVIAHESPRPSSAAWEAGWESQPSTCLLSAKGPVRLLPFGAGKRERGSFPSWDGQAAGPSGSCLGGPASGEQKRGAGARGWLRRAGGILRGELSWPLCPCWAAPPQAVRLLVPEAGESVVLS
uniref:ACB domain-containing protein n=1 Tax=Chelydra serpentina TaxID=8475 RepID=A0A8C3SQC3_CHESE